MESNIQAVEDSLVDNLTFKGENGASYATRREQLTAFASGSNIYSSSSGVKVIRIALQSDGWFDPASLRINFQVNNNHETLAFTPFTGKPSGFFRRYREIISGNVVCDIDNYARTSQMFHMFSSTNKQENLGIGGFSNNATPDNIGAEKSRTVSFHPLGCLVNQPKWIPLRYAPIVLEFEIANSDEVSREGGSQTWTISNVMAKFDCVWLDNNVENEFSQHLLNGKPLNISCSNYATSEQVANASDYNVSVSRSLTRLKSVFFTQYKAPADNTTENTVNKFYHQMGGTYDFTKELTWDMSIGSKRYPTFPVQSQSEFFDKLQQALGVLNNAFHSSDITEYQYCNNKFAIGIDTEKVPGSAFTGINTTNGEMITIRAKNSGLTGATDRVYIVLAFDQIVSIKDSGVEIFE